MRLKPIKDVKTFDGRQHEVDIKQLEKSMKAWGFVDGRMIEGVPAATQIQALTNWKTAYKLQFSAAKE
jgi:hypothetical protein